MTGASDTTDTWPSLSTDELFLVFTAQSRRVVLFHLHQQGAATVDDLVDVVREYIDTRAAVGADDPHRVAMVLAEHHLPLLEQVGLVVYDRLDDTVGLGDTPTDFGDWLDLAVRRDLRWAESQSRSVEADRDGGPVTVLVVDDEPGLADVIGDLLETRHDMATITATTAPDAFTVLESVAVDCVVSDYRMPAIDGLDFLEVVRDDHPDLPFILFTNKGSEEVASEAITHHVTAYVPKGTGADQYDRLAQHIRRAVGGHERPE